MNIAHCNMVACKYAREFLLHFCISKNFSNGEYTMDDNLFDEDDALESFGFNINFSGHCSLC